MIDAIRIHLPETSASSRCAPLLDPVSVVLEHFDKVTHRRASSNQAEDFGVTLEHSGTLGRLASDALILREHDEPVDAGIFDPRFIISLLRPLGAVDIDQSEGGPSEPAAGSGDEVGGKAAIDEDVRRRAW